MILYNRIAVDAFGLNQVRMDESVRTFNLMQGVIYMVLVVSVLGALCSLFGNVLIMLKKKSGWLVWILGNILWIVYNFLSEFNLPMVIMYIVYAIINVCGFVRWKKQDVKD